MTDEHRYRRIVSFVAETAWAIRPSMLAVIRDLIQFRAAGGRLSAEEIEQRIGAARRDRPVTPAAGAVAVLPLRGILVPHAGMMIDVSTVGMGLDEWLNEFQALVDDPSISAIVLDIDSPGGSVDLVTEVATEIRQARARKTVVAAANTDAASAAYWLGAQASELVVTPSGSVGSVGVFAAHEDISRQLEQDGVKVTLVSAGEHKTEGNPFEPLSEEARQAIQDDVDGYYRMFVDDVAKGRQVAPTVVEQSFGQGRMISAADAVRAGMADRVETIDQTITRLVGGAETPRTRAALAPVDVAAARQVTVPAFAGAGSVAATSGADPSFAGPVPGLIFDRPSSAASGATKPPKEGRTMERVQTEDELAARREEIVARMTELNSEWGAQAFDDPAQAEFDELEAELATIDRTVENITARRATLTRIAGDASRSVPGDGGVATRLAGRPPATNAGRRLPDNVWDLAAYRGFARDVDDLANLHREGARRVNETLVFECENQDRPRQHVARLLKRDPKGEFAARLLATSSDLYDRAFGKMLFGQPLSTQEDAAIRAAVSNTGLGGETPVPVTIDPSVMLTSDGQVNPLRAISRNVTITGNTWRGIASEGVTVEYQAELTQVGDQTPAFDSPPATVAKAHGWVEFSIEVDEDWGAFRTELATMFQDAKDAKEAEKFLYGDGTDEPEGLIYKLTQDGTSVVPTGTLNVFDVTDLYALRAALPPRFRAGAAWLANDAFYSAVRGFDEAGGSALWVQLQDDRPARLIGKPVYEASLMADGTDEGGADIAVYGDFGRGFVIVDRVGLNVELVPLVMGANNRPKGSRGIYVYFRNTTQVRTVNAFRLLRVKAT